MGSQRVGYDWERNTIYIYLYIYIYIYKLRTVTATMKLNKHLFLGRKAVTNLDKCIKKQRHHFANKDPYSQSYGFSSSHVWMWELDHKEDWALKKCFPVVVLENILASPLDCKEIKPVSPKGNQPWIFIGRTDAEAEAPVLWLPDAKSQRIGQDTDAGKVEGTRVCMHEWVHVCRHVHARAHTHMHTFKCKLRRKRLESLLYCNLVSIWKRRKLILENEYTESA